MMWLLILYAVAATTVLGLFLTMAMVGHDADQHAETLRHELHQRYLAPPDQR